MILYWPLFIGNSTDGNMKSNGWSATGVTPVPEMSADGDAMTAEPPLCDGESSATCG